MALFINCVQIRILLTGNWPRCFVLHGSQYLSTCVILLLVGRLLLAILRHDVLAARATDSSEFMVWKTCVQIVLESINGCFICGSFLFLHFILDLNKRTLNASLTVLGSLSCLYSWVHRHRRLHVLWRTGVDGNMRYLSQVRLNLFLLSGLIHLFWKFHIQIYY